jgi:hypothetical protein
MCAHISEFKLFGSIGVNLGWLVTTGSGRSATLLIEVTVMKKSEAKKSIGGMFSGESHLVVSWNGIWTIGQLILPFGKKGEIRNVTRLRPQYCI